MNDRREHVSLQHLKPRERAFLHFWRGRPETALRTVRKLSGKATSAVYEVGRCRHNLTLIKPDNQSPPPLLSSPLPRSLANPKCSHDDGREWMCSGGGETFSSAAVVPQSRRFRTDLRSAALNCGEKASEAYLMVWWLIARAFAC